MSRIAVVGAGWAGLAAAVEARRAGHEVTLFEAARTLGGRARSLTVEGPDGRALTLDNGQHILIGAYRSTLDLMQTVGVEPQAVLHALPLRLRRPGGPGLSLPPWPAPLDTAWGVATARGWTWDDKGSLLAAAWRWRRSGFRCPAELTVADLAASLPPRVVRELIEPLCVSALNTLPPQASAQVFLRVLHDALLGEGWGPWGASWLLLPREALGALLPEATARWLQRASAEVRTAHRVTQLAAAVDGRTIGWRLDGEHFDHVVLACSHAEASRLVRVANVDAAGWLARSDGLRHEPIATVYMLGGPRLPEPLLALDSGPDAPAQFVFDRSQVGGPEGLLAFVVSASRGSREAVESAVTAQAHALGWSAVRPLTTVVEKRATFACTPGLQRPALSIAPNLWACGDYVEGPYPATLEGAVRAAGQVIAAISAGGPATATSAPRG